MECIGCGKKGAFNRIIVNQVSGDEIALYCEDCERENFGNLLDNPSWHQEHGCAFCDNPGTYKLPEVDCLIVSEDGSIQDCEYLLFDDVVAICESHLRELIPENTVIEELMPKDERHSSHVRV